MFSSYQRAPLIALAALGVVAVVVFSAMVNRIGPAFGWQGLAAGITALIGLAVVLLLPVHWLPATALVAFVVFPRALVPAQGVLNAAPALSLILVVWVARRLLGARRGNAAARSQLQPQPRSLSRVVIVVCAGLFVLWSLLRTATSDDSSTALAWLTSFTVGALIPILVADARREAQFVRSAWTISGGVMGVYATIELALQGSPLYGALYSVLGVSSIQHWSVYRAEASFHHPLYAGAFLAVAAALGIGRWLSTGERWPLAAGLISAIGVVATVSRGSILAMAIAISIAVVGVIFIEGRAAATRLILVAIIGVIGVVALLNFGALTDRAESSEAALSGDARDTGLVVALRAAESSGWLGTGPGTSGITGRLFDDGVIENSALQLLISVGIPGLALITIMIVALIVRAAKSRDIASAAGLIAYAVCIVGFNAIDALRSMHLLIGLLIVITLNPAIRPIAPNSSGLRRHVARSSGSNSHAPLTGASSRIR